MSMRVAGSDRVHDVEPVGATFFSELHESRTRKKYVSLFDLQDEVLSIKDRRKRDRAIKKSRKRGKEISLTDLSRHSPSDSDIARSRILTKSAKKTLETKWLRSW
ncbi:hypothetical protein V6N13_099673 [Hibiscus sabdariffa]|uniref:Uncharacterized protein n=2 Tax=Hibiscus sabdariffa TaxID=183260 RepID=A0ABR2AL07_9ROSI